MAVERVVLDSFVDPGQVAWPTRRTFVEGLAAYIGETLMRKAGGAWTWTSEPAVFGFPDGTPRGSADPALRLDPVSPVHRLREAVAVRDGERFTQGVRPWGARGRRAVAYRPGVASGQGVDRGRRPGGPGVGATGRVVVTTGRRLSDWVAAYAPDRAWDFTPASLRVLEELVRRVTPTVEELNDPAKLAFREGAAWYLGETVRRDLGGRWNLNLRRSDDRNFPYVERLGPRNARLTPEVALEAELKRPGYLRYRYERASGPPLEV